MAHLGNSQHICGMLMTLEKTLTKHNTESINICFKQSGNLTLGIYNNFLLSESLDHYVIPFLACFQSFCLNFFNLMLGLMLLLVFDFSLHECLFPPFQFHCMHIFVGVVCFL